MINQIEVRVVFYKDENAWVAQCVEHDIAAFARTLKDLPRAIDRAIAANVCVNHDLGREGLDGIPEAPKRFLEMIEPGMKIDFGSTNFALGEDPSAQRAPS